jgi:hypothetical protein
MFSRSGDSTSEGGGGKQFRRSHVTNIDDNLPEVVLIALAEALGFRIAYARQPGVDEWTLSAGHGVNHVQYVGTRASVCAFLAGYAAMKLQTTQMLNDMDNAHRRMVIEMRDR